MKKLQFLFLICLGLVISCTSRKGGNELRVACNLTMTGDFSIYGESVQKGLLMAADDLKDSDKYKDVKVTFDFQDNMSDSKNAVTVYKRQEMKGYDVYVSGITQQSAAIIPMQQKTVHPHFIWAFAPVLFTQEDNLFRTWVDYPQEATCFVEYLKSHPEYKRIACLYPNIESAQFLYNQLFIPNIPEDRELVINEPFDVTMTNFKDVAAKLRRVNPDAIFINGMDMHIPNIIKELSVNGMNKNGNLVFTFDLMDAVPLTAPELLEGLVANIPASELEYSEERSEWNARFNEKYGTTPNYTHAYAYDLGLILYDAAKRCASDETLTIKEALLSTSIPGLTGQLEFTPEGLLKGNYITSRYTNGKFEPIGE